MPVPNSRCSPTQRQLLRTSIDSKCQRNQPNPDLLTARLTAIVQPVQWSPYQSIRWLDSKHLKATYPTVQLRRYHLGFVPCSTTVLSRPGSVLHPAIRQRHNPVRLPLSHHTGKDPFPTHQPLRHPNALSVDFHCQTRFHRPKAVPTDVECRFFVPVKVKHTASH